MSDDGAAQRAEIMRLHYLEGLSIRAIARQLGASRKTVRRNLGQLPQRTRDAPARRVSLLDQYTDEVQQFLLDTPELTATQILHRLRQRGYTGGISILRELVRKLRPEPNSKVYLTVKHEPGATMQVDWGDFGFGLPGIPRRVSAFVALLPYSAYMYLEFVLSQKMGTFLRCMDRAIKYFGGVSNADVFDNMKTVVLEHRPGSKPVFNNRFLSYANARGGFAVIACTPRHPESKGGVERGIRTVRDNFWRGRRFLDLCDLNTQAARWCHDIHNRRIHTTTGKVPHLVFENHERERLKPLPETPFDTDDIEHEIVSSSFRVRFDRNAYSVPWHLQGQQVIVRGTDSHVSAFVGPKCVAQHTRCWDIGVDVEDPEHPKRLREFRRAQPRDLMLDRFGDVGVRYFDTIAVSGKSLRREAIRLAYLAEIFGTRETRSAIEHVMRTGHVGVEYVEFVLRHKRRLVPQFTPLQLGNPALDNIKLAEPDLSIYDPPTLTRDPGPSEEESDEHDG